MFLSLTKLQKKSDFSTFHYLASAYFARGKNHEPAFELKGEVTLAYIHPEEKGSWRNLILFLKFLPIKSGNGTTMTSHAAPSISDALASSSLPIPSISSERSSFGGQRPSLIINPSAVMGPTAVTMAIPDP